MSALDQMWWAWRGGDPAVEPRLMRKLDTLARRYVGRISTAYGLSHELDDLVQEVLIEALRCADRFEGRSPLSSWLYGLARNVVREIRRAEATRHVYEQRARWMHEPRRPDDLFGEKELVERFTAELGRIGQRKSIPVLSLVYLDGERAIDVARMLGMNPHTVNTRLHYGRKALAAAMAAA